MIPPNRPRDQYVRYFLEVVPLHTFVSQFANTLIRNVIISEADNRKKAEVNITPLCRMTSKCIRGLQPLTHFIIYKIILCVFVDAMQYLQKLKYKWEFFSIQFKLVLSFIP